MEPDRIRIEIWHAMSDLYLDEEITVGGYLHIAERIAATTHSLSELDTIFFGEVHPVLCWNLTMVAGQWGYFEKDWVKERILDKINEKQMKEGWVKRRMRMQRLEKVKQLEALVKCDWEKVKLLIEIIRGRGLQEIFSAKGAQ